MPLSSILPDRFILALLLALGLASFLPARGGFALAVDSLSTAAVVLLFFLHGVRLPREAVIAGIVHWRLHLVILFCTFLLFPMLGLVASRIAPDLLPGPLWIGVLFLCALPSTVQSSIAFTSIARGNVPAAIAAATASNLAGMVLTPALVSLLVHAQGAEISVSGVWKIMSQLLAPFLIGHLVRPWLGEWARNNKTLLAFTDRGTIVLAVYSAFSAAVLAGLWHTISLGTLLTLAGLCAVLLLGVLVATALGSRKLGFSKADEIAIVFCGSKKSLVSGVPMAKILFTGTAMGGVVVPLLVFHQMQLIVCAWLARRYAAGEHDVTAWDAARPYSTSNDRETGHV